MSMSSGIMSTGMFSERTGRPEMRDGSIGSPAAIGRIAT